MRTIEYNCNATVDEALSIHSSRFGLEAGPKNAEVRTRHEVEEATNDESGRPTCTSTT